MWVSFLLFKKINSKSITRENGFVALFLSFIHIDSFPNYFDENNFVAFFFTHWQVCQKTIVNDIFFHPIKVVVFQNRAKAFSQAVPFEPVSVAMHPTRPIVAVCGAKVRLIEIFWKFICLCKHTYYSVVIFTPICGHIYTHLWSYLHQSVVIFTPICGPIYTNLWSYLHQSAILGQSEGTKFHGIFSFLPCKS